MPEQIRVDQKFDRARQGDREEGLEPRRPDGYVRPEDIPSGGRTPEEEMIAKEEEKEE